MNYEMSLNCIMMEGILKYPVGIHTFSEIIKEKYLYVDKTALIYELVSRYKYVFLSRPRRFGKSLLVSTLGSYFKGQKELFEGLEIGKLEKEWLSHPVFRFDLSGENFNHPSRLLNRINRCFKDICDEYELKEEGYTISDSLAVLIKQAYNKYGRKVVILIDEYDKPILDCLHQSDIHEEIKAELRGFYSVIKAYDEYVKFAMLTGVTRFSKVSIFSGPNNLSDISMLSRFNAICGISESELRHNFQRSVKIFADENGYSESETWNRFKEMYDGYHFSERGEFIYNPFSVLSAFNEEKISSYWFRSASPNFLIKLIESHNYPLDSLDGEKRSEMELCSHDNIDSDLVSLLFQSGYLTIKAYDEATRTYTLGFPNIEVYEGFWNSLAKHFFKGYDGKSAFDLYKLLKDIKEGRPEDFMIRIQSLLSDIPYPTDKKEDNDKRREGHFRDMMAIAMKLLGFHVGCEVHSSAGRCDMQILTDRFIYIFEFKINGTPQSALQQIENKGYQRPFRSDRRLKFLIGATFSTETNTLTDWLIKEII